MTAGLRTLLVFFAALSPSIFVDRAVATDLHNERYPVAPCAYGSNGCASSTSTSYRSECSELMVNQQGTTKYVSVCYRPPNLGSRKQIIPGTGYGGTNANSESSARNQ